MDYGWCTHQLSILFSSLHKDTTGNSFCVYLKRSVYAFINPFYLTPETLCDQLATVGPHKPNWLDWGEQHLQVTKVLSFVLSVILMR